jgi:hypothetical protein
MGKDYALSQNLPIDTSYNKWVHAIINIEGRSSNQKESDYYYQLFRSKKISWDDYIKADENITIRGDGVRGTAILIEDNGLHFLLSARHMFFDPNNNSGYVNISQYAVFQKIILIENDTILNNRKYSVDSNGNISGDTSNIFLMNYSAGSYELNPYIFTSIENDIGILCLDFHGDKEFYKTLINRGYKPIRIKDFDSTFSVKNGDNIYSIGFPENSILGSNGISIFENVWASNIVSIPVVTKGVYRPNNFVTPIFFDAAIFTFHGFSGAPIIKNDKLIGLVSGGESKVPFLTGDKLPFKYIYQNHSKFIKSTFILSVLRELEAKINGIRSYLH